MTNRALEVFERLSDQVVQLKSVADVIGHDVKADAIRRSAFVLAVAGVDTYFHELAIARLRAAALASESNATRIATYLGQTAAAQLIAETGENMIRLRLSYKTLVAPLSLDKAIEAWGGDPDEHWLAVALARSTRPDRLKRQLELVYDRRNQIAHEGDWDQVEFDFRPMRDSHLEECIATVDVVVRGFDEAVASRS